MTDIDILHEMIKDDARLTLTESHIPNKKSVTLIEPREPQSSVTLLGLPASSIVIKVDAFKSPNTVFDCSKGECKRADFVIISSTIDKKMIICIEMKKTRKLAWEIIEQLKGAQCFVVYCREIGRLFWECPDFLNGYQLRFISITHISISKKKTRIDCSSGLHDKPAKMMKISWARELQFDRITG